MEWMNYQLPNLSEGGHEEGSGELCAMEMVAFMERLPHSDRPECTCPVLAAYVRCLNDRMPDSRRNEIQPILPLLVDTVSPSLEHTRAEYFAMQMVTKLVPIVLDGRIGPELVSAMRDAEALDVACDAARAANAAAYAYAADAAYTAANAAANAAAYAYAAADAAYAADADAYAAANAAANAAAYAYAYAAADAARAAADHDFWAHAIEILKGAIELDPKIKPAQWEPVRVEELVKEFT